MEMYGIFNLKQQSEIAGINKYEITKLYLLEYKKFEKAILSD